MSHLYLSHHMKLDTEKFSRRMRRLYDAWMIPENSTENDALSSVDCFVVAVGDDDDSKSISFHKWLFGYGLNNTICVFTPDIMCVLATKKGIEFLKRAENCMEQKVQLLVCDQTDNNNRNFTKLLDMMKLSRNGKRVGVFSKDVLTGRLCESWQTEMAAYNFETEIDIGASIAYIMAVKEESELTIIRNACLVSTDVFKSYLKPHILEIINDVQDVKHSKLAEGVELALNNKKIILDWIDTAQLKLCYPPIIQSGGNYRLGYNVGSDDNYLQSSGAIVCSFGVRYKSYCSNISRTLLLINPSDTMQLNYNFIQSLEKELLKKLIPGVKLCEIYESGLEYAKKMRPDLVKHLAQTFGFAIGIEFCESSLTIGPKCIAIVKQNMVFNVCVGLTGLINDQAVDAFGKTYALSHSDTVIVNEWPDSASILTSTYRPPYLALLVDCWAHIMDFLSFEDVLAMGQTCKAMHLLTGYYLRKNFSHRYFVVDETIEYYTNYNSYTHSYNYKQINVTSNFWQFIGGLEIWGHSELKLDAKTFSSLTALHFYDYDFTETELQFFENVLMNVENVEITDSAIADGIVDQLVNCCPKLKRLIISNCEILGATEHVWFSKNYPALEHLAYEDAENIQIDELKVFLEKHPKLKCFEIDARMLWANRDLLNETNIQLDVFGISFYFENGTVPVIQIFDFAKTLYERGFYKVLRLKFIDYAIDGIDIATLTTVYASSGLINVQKLHIDSVKESADKLEFLAKNLMKLDFLTFNDATFDQILPFIRHSKCLKTIKICALSETFFDTFTLNEEREELENAVHTTIYLPDDVYLTEIGKSKNLNLKHVKILRLSGDF